jgi:hypothetical protein
MPRRRASVLTHRLFPGLCALWFGALFGLGCLVAGNAALGAMVVALHLPAVLPAAAPPLGMTARLVLALAFAGLGGAIGLATGLALFARAGGKWPVRTVPQRETAAPEQSAAEPVLRVRNRDAHPDAPPRRPLVVTEDVLPYPTAMVETPVQDDDTVDEGLGSFAYGAALPPFLAAAYSAVNAPAHGASPLAPEPTVAPEAPVVAEPEPEPAAMAAPIAPLAVAAPAPSAPPLASLAAAAPKAPLNELPLTGLGLVQLIERLAQAIAVRQQHCAAALEVAVASELYDMRTPLHRFDPLTMDPTGPLLRAKKGRAEPHGALPDPLAAVLDADDAAFAGDDQAETATAQDREFEDGAIEPTIEHRYSALTDMALPRPELVDFPAPQAEGREIAGAASDPVVPFPQRLPTGESAQPAASADRALREALATLRQMTAHR